MEYSMVAMRPGAPVPHDATTRAAPGGRSPLRRFFGIAVDPRAWLRFLYLALAFPAGLASFVALVTLLAVGGGMLITIVGIPLLALTLYGWCLAADAERLLSNLLLGTRIPRLSFRESGPLWGWSRLKRRLANPLTWKSLIFLLLRFPLGVLSLVLLCLVFFPVAFAAAPVITLFGGEIQLSPGSSLDTWWQTLPLAIVGVPATVLFLHLLNLFAIANGTLATALLSGGRAPSPSSVAPTAPARGELPGLPAPVLVAPVPLAEAVPAALETAATSPVVIEPPAPAAIEPPPPVARAAEPVTPAAEPEPRLTVDVVMRIVTVEGRRVELTPREFDLLALFVQNPNRPFSRDELLDRIWKHDFEVTDRTIDTHVQRLRKKLGPGAAAIRTVWGVGYRFEPDAVDTAPEEDAVPGQ